MIKLKIKGSNSLVPNKDRLNQSRHKAKNNLTIRPLLEVQWKALQEAAKEASHFNHQYQLHQHQVLDKHQARRRKHKFTST